MSPPYLDILETAIDQYKISNVEYIEGEEGWTIIETKTIRIPSPETLHNLLTGLHEVGHIALEHPTRWGLPWSWTLPEKKKILKEEREAWKFALQEIDKREIFINAETLGACHSHYKEYIKDLLL